MAKELSDFLKTAYKHGKVKDLKEAFKQFPVEEEQHKGKIENVIKEDSETYNTEYGIGDIIFKIGKVDDEKIEEYKSSFYENLKNNNFNNG